MRSFIKNRLGDYAYPIIIAIVALIIVGIIAGVVYSKRDKVEAQRTAKIVEVNGPCTVMREGALLNAVADMPLYSGDTFYSGIDASARIMIDDDKFLYLDPTTRINFTASGTPEETHTLIYVETGSMLTEVKEKLADGESFDIVTPNSFMEIHGTKTLTQVVADPQGNITTSAAVLQGNVKFATVKLSDGQIVYVQEDLIAGQSLGVETEKGDLVTADELKQIVQTGQSSSGVILVLPTYDEAGIIKSDSDFSSDFLDNVIAVLLVSEQEDNANGISGSDSDKNGVSDPIDNTNALRKTGEDPKVADAGDVGETEEERLAREEKERAEKEKAEREEADRLAAEEAERLAAEKAEDEARHRAEEAERTQQIQAIEAAEAEVAAYNQALAEAQAEAERQAAAQAEAERQAAEQAASNNSSSTPPSDSSSSDSSTSDPSTSDPSDPSTSDPSDPSSSTLNEGDEDPINHGTFTGYYTADGHPLYLTSAETYYYLEEPNSDGVVSYTGELYPEPPTDP